MRLYDFDLLLTMMLLFDCSGRRRRHFGVVVVTLQSFAGRLQLTMVFVALLVIAVV